jgi:hypothetical protein
MKFPQRPRQNWRLLSFTDPGHSLLAPLYPDGFGMSIALEEASWALVFYASAERLRTIFTFLCSTILIPYATQAG